MSEEEVSDTIHEDLKKFRQFWTLLLKVSWLIAAAAASFGGWVATLELRQRESGETDQKQTKILEEIQQWVTATENNRWTIRDHQAWSEAHTVEMSKMLEAIAKRNELQELRLQRLEDNQSRLQDQQGKMQQTITEKLQVTPSDVLKELQEMRKRME